MSYAEKFMREKMVARKSLRSAAICKMYMFGSKLRFSAFTHSSMHAMLWNCNEEKYEKKVELHFIICKTNVFASVRNLVSSSPLFYSIQHTLRASMAYCVKCELKIALFSFFFFHCKHETFSCSHSLL